MADLLQFRSVTGEQVEVGARVDDAEFGAGELLVGRRIWLDDGLELRQHRTARGPRREEGYERLDNEILAGRRLYEAASWAASYPPEVACLYGDEAASSDPFTLFEQYRGEPLREVGGNLLDYEKKDFQVSLLRGLCWLAAAGIAHRAIGPDTVLWDRHRRSAQIIDFSRCTVFGVPRTPVKGSAAWVPEEQRPGTTRGRVGPRDDIWAAGQLIFYAHNQGEEFVHRDQLAASGLTGPLGQLLGQALGPPEARPIAGELLALLGQPDPAPGGFTIGGWLGEGRARFLAARTRKHPGAPVPPGFDEDLAWARDIAAAAAPPTASFSDPPPVGSPPVGPSAGEPPDASRHTDTAPAPRRPPEEPKTRPFRRRRGDP